ncbi:MAG: DoxX family protein, partial [Chloroflexota bacterium]
QQAAAGGASTRLWRGCFRVRETPLDPGVRGLVLTTGLDDARMKLVMRMVLALFMIGAGVMHFVRPQGFIRVVPTFLPAPAELVFISGVFEVLGGAGLLVQRTQRWAAWGLVALFVAVFPANVNMAVNHIGLGTTRGAAWLLWARLPLQALLIAWAYWFARRAEA